MSTDKEPDANGFRHGDPRFVDFNNAGERAYWCKYFNVTEPELYAAVVAAGTNAQAVKEWVSAKRDATGLE
jgi:hypothetical protein